MAAGVAFCGRWVFQWECHWLPQARAAALIPRGRTAALWVLGHGRAGSSTTKKCVEPGGMEVKGNRDPMTDMKLVILGKETVSREVGCTGVWVEASGGINSCVWSASCVN